MVIEIVPGLALSQLHREDDAAGYWQKAADVNPGLTHATFYKALALAELGKKRESHEVLRELLEGARRQLDQEVKVDYFATSLPNFLLFEDDLQKRTRVECLFLMGLAQLGLENREDASAALREALSLDMNHLRAQQELEWLRASPLV
jgi:tetratricopeptide (TPR) repeat protein